MSGQRSVKLRLGSDERVFCSYRELEDYAAQLTREMRTCEAQLQHDPRNVTLWQQLEEAAEYPTPAVIQALLRIVRECTGVKAYGAVASLLVMHGKLDSVYSMDRRQFILRFVDPPNPDREAAYTELSSELGL